MIHFCKVHPRQELERDRLVAVARIDRVRNEKSSQSEFFFFRSLTEKEVDRLYSQRGEMLFDQ